MQCPEGYLFFTTTTGEEFLVPADNYDEEIQLYYTALRTSAEDFAAMFEDGVTGWRRVPKGSRIRVID